jgi:16S rRNA (cytosine1402-N4)-methyltransferase
VIEGMHLQPNGLYVDATFGGGGHTRAMLEAEPTCTVIGIDWDQKALDINAPLIHEEFGERFIPLWGCFAHLHRLLKKEKIPSINGLLADFGTSQFQLHHEDGFSFNHDTPLDMRMSTAHQPRTAADILHRSSEEELAYIFFTYGEESRSRKIARAIVEERNKEPFKRTFKTTFDLATLVERVCPRQGKSNHPATKVFQALRIAVNHELDNIEMMLKATLGYLAPGGRLSCISFHSLEDRLVKQFYKEHQDSLKIITPKPVTASVEELEANRSSRSAKLRVAEKK